MKSSAPRIRQSVADRRKVQTLRRLIANIAAETGAEPSNAELARLLARSEASITRLRTMIGGEP